MVPPYTRATHDFSACWCTAGPSACSVLFSLSIPAPGGVGFLLAPGLQPAPVKSPGSACVCLRRCVRAPQLRLFGRRRGLQGLWSQSRTWFKELHCTDTDVVKKYEKSTNFQ